MERNRRNESDHCEQPSHPHVERHMDHDSLAHGVQQGNCWQEVFNLTRHSAQVRLKNSYGLTRIQPYRFEVRLFGDDEITVCIKVASQFRSFNVYQLTEQLRVIEVFHTRTPTQTCIN